EPKRPLGQKADIHVSAISTLVISGHWHNCCWKGRPLTRSCREDSCRSCWHVPAPVSARPLARLSRAHLVGRVQSAGKIVERQLRRCKIISRTHSADRPGILLHGYDRTHVSVCVDKREAWSLDRGRFRKRDCTQC